MLRPQTNACRTAQDLSGIWHIRLDPDDAGRAAGWASGLQGQGFATAPLPIAVPGSWNEQLSEAGATNHVGPAWMTREFYLPELRAGEVAELRFGSADYFADVWIDGGLAGSSGAAMLPFTVPVATGPHPGGTRLLVVRVTNELPIDGPTQRVTQADYVAERRPRDEYLPAVRFDFFPFGGINRPVHLVIRPALAISSYRVRTPVKPVPMVEVDISASGGTLCRVTLIDLREGRVAASAETALTGGDASMAVPVPDARLWSPTDPFLYQLKIELVDGERIIDQIDQRLGLRDVRVEGTSLLLNGQPLTLTGCGKHEDSPLHGRGLNLPQLAKDFQLLKWLGANSVRTSHYPYAEEFLDMADEMGVLVIDEVFSINLDFRKVNAATLAAHRQAATALIARDTNRTCVIAWSLANEPGYLAEPEYRSESGPYWAELFAHARALDPTRPMTHANVGYAGNDDPAFGEADFLMINRYHGWYSEPAQLDRATARLTADLDAIAVHGKPILISEFGADALAGQHATYPQMFTEEYQADFIAAYWDVITAHSACIGGHVWAFADFRTAQHGRRVVNNLKGLFTRTREPKMAAWRVRQLWTGQ
ncbi:MAG: beta-galactosidase [Sphingopyxis sp.]|nr:beta-galactosidase [Sphingopyxis sp.]